MGQIGSKCCFQCFIGSGEDDLGNLSSDSSTPEEVDCQKPDLQKLIESSSLSREMRGEPSPGYDRFVQILKGDDSDFKVIKSTPQITVKAGDEGNYFILKSTWNIDFTPREFLDFYYNIEERPKWDKNLEKIERTDEFEYVVYKKVGLITQRELLTHRQEFQLEDGLFCLSHSVQHHSLPENEDIVRMDLAFGGYFVKQVNENTSEVVAISKLDIRGNVPKAMVKSLTALTMPQLAKNMTARMKCFYEGE